MVDKSICIGGGVPTLNEFFLGLFLVVVLDTKKLDPSLACHWATARSFGLEVSNNLVARSIESAIEPCVDFEGIASGDHLP